MPYAEQDLESSKRLDAALAGCGAAKLWVNLKKEFRAELRSRF